MSTAGGKLKKNLQTLRHSHFLNTFSLCSWQDTKNVAKALGACVRKGDVVLLCGDLGSGKTALVRLTLQAMRGDDVRVQSPTFPLILTYDTPQGPVWHADLYRLTPDEIPSLGLEEAWDERITFIEWPDRLTACPPHPLLLDLTVDAPRGKRTLSCYGERPWPQRWEGTA
ncbi:tRNA (adenosine(37)-N6)-threonylcarbamoyltransferase complex ATPase subunit type 1 TsaE [bacterium NHP-B]|nr:tRNA (adenosine(37)-N6)-threonylcarbamoyltransferase complex ATPase subunit type 1 TsaE [bacterium NHP-B]